MVQDPETSLYKNLMKEKIRMTITCRTEGGGQEHGVGLPVPGGEAREVVLVTGGVGDGGQHVRLHKGLQTS